MKRFVYLLCSILFSMACLHVIADESRSMRLMSNGEVKASYIVSDIDSIIFVRTTVYHLIFDANGGEGEMSAQTLEAGVSQALAANTFTRDGYDFTGWNTKADGSGTSYTNKQIITLTQDITLYAQWKVIATTGYENGYEWVDLGLPSGAKWATCNVGATSPESYGNYYAWGETEPKTNYDFSTYKYCNGSYDTMTKYCTERGYGYNGFTDGKTTLELSDDAARANWGGAWRMPTYNEWYELKNSCTWTPTTQNGVSGHKVTSKTNGNSIFLPAAGYRYGTSVYNVGSYGYYWSSSLFESDPSGAYYLYFYSGYVDWNGNYRNYGHTVRAVCYTGFSIVTFDANGGEGEMPAQTFEADVSQALAANTFTRDGYVFTGWNTAANGSGTVYTDGQVITLTHDIKLYAQWQVVSGTENGYAYVDLGLPSGAKWATYNVGADSPYEFGDYFAWGETSPKSKYTWETYKYCNGSSNTMTKYCTQSSYGYNGFTDGKTTLDLIDDAARANWGGTWRMPTAAEQNELRNNCTWTWITQNGVNGYKVTSKTNGNSIFLPAAGYRDGTSVYDVGSYGRYWSSSLTESYPSCASYLSFYSGTVDWYIDNRDYGRTVRAVCP